VELHPKLKFSGDLQPTEQELDEMHHFAHTECFIANSVKTKVTVEK
jgi:organic hydroperoxide reductase OsmC/OhrA